MRNESKLEQNVMGDHAWAFESESIDRLPEGTYSIGAGRHFLKETGMTDEMVGAMMEQLIDILQKSPALTLDVSGIHVYVIRRDKAIDICTQADIVDLGWEEAAKLIDEHSEPL